MPRRPARKSDDEWTYDKHADLADLRVDAKLGAHLIDADREGTRGKADEERHKAEQDRHAPLATLGPIHRVFRIVLQGRRTNLSSRATP
jgi:hypothetical protein